MRLQQDVNKAKARFRWVYHPLFVEGGYWSYMNYNAETIHLIKVYGIAEDKVRRYKE